jgi:hypothetical protein
MIVVCNGGKSVVYDNLSKEEAAKHFEQAVLEDELTVLFVEGSYVERLTDGVDDDEKEIVEWEEIGHNFNHHIQ